VSTTALTGTGHYLFEAVIPNYLHCGPQTQKETPSVAKVPEQPKSR